MKKEMNKQKTQPITFKIVNWKKLRNNDQNKGEIKQTMTISSILMKFSNYSFTTWRRTKFKEMPKPSFFRQKITKNYAIEMYLNSNCKKSFVCKRSRGNILNFMQRKSNCSVQMGK